jgi:hypothetical protein
MISAAGQEWWSVISTCLPKVPFSRAARAAGSTAGHAQVFGLVAGQLPGDDPPDPWLAGDLPDPGLDFLLGPAAWPPARVAVSSSSFWPALASVVPSPRARASCRFRGVSHGRGRGGGHLRGDDRAAPPRAGPAQPHGALPGQIRRLVVTEAVLLAVATRPASRCWAAAAQARRGRARRLRWDGDDELHVSTTMHLPPRPATARSPQRPQPMTTRTTPTTGGDPVSASHGSATRWRVISH